MNYISFKQLWSDYDLIELEISVSSDGSVFKNTVFTHSEKMEEMIQNMFALSNDQISTLNIELGSAGSEWANGYTQINMKINSAGLICISTFQQSGFAPTGNDKIADEAKFHVVSEPVLLDYFINKFHKIRNLSAMLEVLTPDDDPALQKACHEHVMNHEKINIQDEVFIECLKNVNFANFQDGF
jgi:hypothetical protein